MDGEKKDIKILIADDEECIRELVGYALEKRGFTINRAGNGKEALEQIAHYKPDIVILDITMPLLNGLDVCKRLRESRETQDIPIIFLSAQDYRDKIKNMPGAAIKFIDKPCDLGYLLNEINSLIKKQTTP